MAPPPLGEQLEDTRYVTAVLRFVLDREGRMLRGEIADAAGRATRRFTDWDGALRALKSWLAAQVREN